MAAFRHAVNVTARCCYGVHVCQLLLGYVTTRCGSSLDPNFDPCSSSAVVRASDKVAESCGFKSYLGLGFFSEFSLHLIPIYLSRIIRSYRAIVLVVNSYTLADILIKQLKNQD